MSEEKNDDIVVNTEETKTQTPEIEIRDDKPAELSTEDALAELQRKLETAEATAKAANERAHQAERQAAEARNAVSDTDLQLVIGAIDSVRRENEIAKANYRAAMSTSDFDRAAEYQEMLSTNAAKLLQLENGRMALENKPKERPVPADPVEAFASQLTARSADWIRQHPQCVTDPRLQQKMIAAHNLALADGITPDTNEYFAAVEGTLGMKRAAEAPQAAESPLSSASRPKNSPPPAAPASRETGGRSNVVRLSAEEREMATMMKMTDQEYAKAKLALQKEGKLH